MSEARHRTPQAALRQVLLAERAKLTIKPLTRKRREAIATCGRLLSKLALLDSLDAVR
jgi:hypothetical protein